MKDFACVVAADLDGAIGKDNEIPWPRLKIDLRFLKTLTCTAAPGMQNAILMGRKTWESIPVHLRPLPGRLTVVISRGPLDLAPPTLHAASLDGALAAAEAAGVDQVFCLGGAQIYAQAFAHPRCRSIYLTRIEARFDGDAHLPPLDGFAPAEAIEPRAHEAGLVYSIVRWDRVTPRPGT